MAKKSGDFRDYGWASMTPDFGISPSKLFKEGLLVLGNPSNPKVFSVPFGEGGRDELRLLEGEERDAALRGEGGDVRSMVQNAMRTAKDGGLVRGAGKATKGRGRGKMV